MESSANDRKRRKSFAWTTLLETSAPMEKSLHPNFKQSQTVWYNLRHNLLYGCKLWVISKAIMEDNINAFGISCYRIMRSIKRIGKVINVFIYNLTETTPLVERTRAIN